MLYNTPAVADLGPSFYADQVEHIVSPIKSTLIIAPAILLRQWRLEISTRAPGLRVLLYEGRNSPQIKSLMAEFERKRNVAR